MQARTGCRATTTLPRGNPTMPQHIEARPALPRNAIRCALVVAAWVLMGAAHAQVDVKDAEAEKFLDKIDSTTGDIKKSASDILSQLKNSTQNLGFAATLTPNNKLQKVGDVSGYISQACPGSGAGEGSAASAGASTSGQPLTSLTTISAIGGSDAAQKICRELIQLRVQSFNETIDMANRFEQYSQQLTSIDNKRSSSNTHGDVQALTNEAARTTAKLQAEMGFWRTRIDAYDAAIKFHEGQQNTLTKIAMKGTGGGGATAESFGRMNAGQLVQAAAIAAALAVK
ncbi:MULTISPECIES: hypothetical protein [Variovorax]|uniref:hypothetical protein n=1 Tax=Variovorax TaxID=34072 RepID=UPI00285E827B|nr:hypothetical protein [Variovorax sp. 3319]MDR6885998.1 hypothetical protein [Variovorax sp. 3319]